MAENNNTQAKKPISKVKKGWIIFGIIFSLIVAAAVGGLVYINHNQTEVSSNIMYLFMPKAITGHDNGNEITFYVEKNKDFNPKKDAPLNAYKIYYYDKNDKRVDTYQGHYKSPTNQIEAGLGFLISAKKNMNIFGNFLKVVLSAAALVAIVLLILLWYKLWNKKMDRIEALQAEEMERDLERQRYLDNQRYEASLSDKKVKKAKKNKKK